MLDSQDLQAIAQMIATATAEAVKPIYAAMSGQIPASVQPVSTPEESAAEKEEADLEAFAKEVRQSLIRSGRVAPQNDAERKLWRDCHGYDYTNSKDIR